MVRRLHSYHHKRRIRKKWKLGEFTEWGVDVHGTIVHGKHEEFFDKMVDWLEARGLGMIGGIHPDGFDLIIAVFDPKRSNRSITDDEIRLLPLALTEAGAIATTVSPKIDTNGP